MRKLYVVEFVLAVCLPVRSLSRMAYDEGLAERIREILQQTSLETTEKKMFGGLAFLREGKMFLGVVGDDLMVRVGPKRYDEALTQPGAREMDFTGRPMRGYIFVGPSGYEDDDQLATWIEHGRMFVEALLTP